MTSDRIKEIQEATAYPESHSVSVALHTVWNETLQEINHRTCESCKYSNDKTLMNTLVCNLSVTSNSNYHWKSQVDKDFGCNKWEPKDAK